MEYSGAWGKLIHEKTRNRKSRGTVPFIPKWGAQKLKQFHTVSSHACEKVLHNLTSANK
jgi:hypothetical protein